MLISDTDVERVIAAVDECGSVEAAAHKLAVSDEYVWSCLAARGITRMTDEERRMGERLLASVERVPEDG